MTPAMVDARALWWAAAEVCDCAAPDEDYQCMHDTTGGWVSPLSIGEIDGWGYITDRYVLLPISRLGGMPVGYGQKLGLEPVKPQALEGFAEWLNCRVDPGPSDRVFTRRLIDPIEAAGLLIRPLQSRVDVHGICEPDLQTLIGLITPLPRNLELDDNPHVRVVAA